MKDLAIYLFFPFFFLPPWRCFSHILRACACNPSLTTAGNGTKPYSRFVTLSLLGARCGLARGQFFVFTLISEIWKNLYETTLLFGWSDQYVLNHGKSRDISLSQPLPFLMLQDKVSLCSACIPAIYSEMGSLIPAIKCPMLQPS